VALADRVVLIKDGAIGMDCAIAPPRPRGNPRFAMLKAQIRARVLQPA
jgi:hypothetical protein